MEPPGGSREEGDEARKVQGGNAPVAQDLGQQSFDNEDGSIAGSNFYSTRTIAIAKYVSVITGLKVKMCLAGIDAYSPDRNDRGAFDNNQDLCCRAAASGFHGVWSHRLHALPGSCGLCATDVPPMESAKFPRPKHEPGAKAS